MRVCALPGVLATVAAALVLAGCGSTVTTSPPPTGSPASGSAQQIRAHNQADIAFAQAMIPHHAQAIEMARLATSRAQSPQVKDLAGRIEQAQSPQIATMTTWLRTWNAAVPAAGQAGMGHTGAGQMPAMGTGQQMSMSQTPAMGAGQTPGMMDSQQMQQLQQATGAEFDRTFLQMMISHHQGAIAMARTELADGQNPQATQHAQQIIDAQQSEIQNMQKLLQQG